MKNRLRLILVLVFVCTVGSAYGQKSKPYSEDDAKVGGRMQQVTGKVVFLDDDNKKVPASGQYLIFKREGCKNCLVGIETDRDGNYKLSLGLGKYKLITQWKNCGYAGYDCAGHNYLSADQPQYLLVKRGLYGPEFNIELVYAPDLWPDIKIVE